VGFTFRQNLKNLLPNFQTSKPPNGALSFGEIVVGLWLKYVSDLAKK